MTNQEAIDFIRAIHVQMFNDGKYKCAEACEMAISALEKKTPKEPAVMIDTWICPSCNNGIEYQFLLGDNVLFHGFHDFCPNCGQKICWEDE